MVGWEAEGGLGGSTALGLTGAAGMLCTPQQSPDLSDEVQKVSNAFIMG